MAVASALPLFLLIAAPFSWAWLAVCLSVYTVIYITLAIAACFAFGGDDSAVTSYTGYTFH